VILVEFKDFVSIVGAMALMYFISIPINLGVEIYLGLQAANVAELVTDIFIFGFASIRAQKKLIANSESTEKQKKLGYIVAWCSTILIFTLNNIDTIRNVF